MIMDTAVDERLWWCCQCERVCDHAPCEHCGAPADCVLVLAAGMTPPSTEAEAEAIGSVEDYDWPPDTWQGNSPAMGARA
jgi:hypothetical protein